MKKKVLALSIAAMIGGVAHAGVSFPGTAVATTATTLAVTPDGIGHQLLVPYFSTNAGNSTLISVVNTDTVMGKAVKVRFRSAVNSDDIFDFQVFMSPGDVWTAAVSQGADGRSVMTTNDKSCTLPVSINQAFITDRLPATADAATKASWTREGYVEIFNMADIADDAAVTTDLFTRVKHVAGVAPCLGTGASAALITALQTDPASGVAAEGAPLNFRAPSTGLMGSWTLINVAGASVAWSGNMVAIRANQGLVAGMPAGTGRIVFSPQMATAAVNVDNLTSDPLLRTTLVTEGVEVANPILTAAMFDLPDMSTPYTGVAALDGNAPIAQANQVSAALSVNSLVNEYLTDTSITAGTDWTFSMPTRRYGVAVNYAQTGANKRVYTTGNLYFTAANTSMEGLLVCVAASTLQSYDREEQFPSSGFVISPGTPSSLSFCGETSVLTFNSTTTLGAALAVKNIDATYRDGWLSIATPGLAAAGLPIIGHSFVKATGPVVAGKSTNFGITNEHRSY